MAPTVAFMSRSQMKFKWRSSVDKKTCKPYNTNRTAAQAKNTHSKFLRILGPYSILHSKRPPCVSLPESHAPAEEQGSSFLWLRFLAFKAGQWNYSWFDKHVFPEQIMVRLILLESPPDKIPYPDSPGAHQEISHPKNHIENRLKYRNYRGTTDITWFQPTPQSLQRSLEVLSTVEQVPWPPTLCASPSKAMTSPLRALRRPRRTAGTSSPLKWIATSQGETNERLYTIKKWWQIKSKKTYSIGIMWRWDASKSCSQNWISFAIMKELVVGGSPNVIKETRQLGKAS